jgi:choline monooxygenase
MSKLLGANELSPTPFPFTTHLPLSWYFDPAIYQRELEVLFKNGPGYVGHELMTPHENDFRTLETRDSAWSLVNTGAGVEMVSNVCRHRQALMLGGSGNLPGGNIVCPLHRWTYNKQGTLLGAPHFAEQPCLNLPKKPLKKWNGMLFDGPRDIAADLSRLGCAADLSFDGYVLHKVEVAEYRFNWKTFIEVYLEDYHVQPFHPGLGQFVDCEQLQWEYGDWHSVQTVGIHKDLAQPGTAVYKKWHESVLGFRGGEVPKQGAIWLTYYPNLMVEWYPHVLVISTIVPRGPERCSNVVEFYYPEEIALFEPEFVASEQAAYAETAVEDNEICQRMHDGRKRLWQEGREEHGPYQSPMEDGMVHFHEFMRRELA